MDLNIDLKQIEKNISDEIVENATNRVIADLDYSISNIVKDRIEKAVDKKLKSLLDDFLDKEILPQDSYGSKQPSTTVRNEISKAIQKQCVYNDRGYSNDNNVLTNAVKSVVEKQLSTIRMDFWKACDKELMSSAINFVRKELFEKLGIKEPK